MDDPALTDTSLIGVAIFIALSRLKLLMLLVTLVWKAFSLLRMLQISAVVM